MVSEANDIQVDWPILLADLANLSATGFRLVDLGGRTIAEAGQEVPVCQIMHDSEAGLRFCEQHCWSGISLADSTNSQTCRAQIARIVFPVEIGGEPVGYLLCGGGRSNDENDEDPMLSELIGELEARSKVTAPELRDAYQLSQSNSPTQVKELSQTMGPLLAQKLSESILSAAIRAVRQQATETDSGSLWGRLAAAIQFVVSPASEVEIFVVAPARDAIDRVWPEQGWDGSDRYDDFRAAEGHPTRDDQGRLIILLQNKDTARVLGAFRVRPPHGKPCREVLIPHLQQLADATAEVLLFRRERKARVILEDLDPQLRSTRSYQDRLQMILERCKHELDCDDGEVVLRTTGKGQRLRIVAHTGLENDDLRLSLHAGGVIGQRILKTSPHVVMDTSRDENYLLTLNGTEHHKALKAFRDHLLPIRSFVTLPLGIGGEVLGVLNLHRRAPLPFRLGLVHVLEIVAERAAVEAACILASEQAAQTAWRNARRNKRLRQAIEDDGPGALLKRVEGLPPAQARHTLLNHLSETALLKGEAYRSAVCLVDPDCAKVAVVAKKGEWPVSMCMEILLSEPNSAVARAIKDVQTYRVPDVNKPGTCYMRNEPDRTQSTIAILLKYGTHILGVLAVEWDKVDAFDDELVSSLELLAGSYSWVIKRFGVDQQMVRLESILPRSTIDPQWEPDYEKFLRAVAEMLNVGEGEIFIRDPGTGRHLLKAALPTSQERAGSLWYEHGECITGWIIQSNQPIKADNVWDPADIGKIDATLGKVSVRKPDDNYLPDDRPIAILGVPIAFGEEIFGVLRLHIDPNLRKFDAADQHIALDATSRLSNFLNLREQAKRTGAKLRLWSRIPEIRDLQPMAEAIHTTLLEGIGGCAAHIRMLDKIEKGVGPAVDVLHLIWSRPPEWLSDDDWTNSVRPAWSGPNQCFTQSEGSITGKVWREEKTFVDLNVNDTSEGGRLAEQSPDFYRNVGALVLTPLVLESGEFEGTLHVYRKYHHSFSKMDIDFIEDVAKIAAKGLVAAREKEMRELDSELRGLGDKYVYYDLPKGEATELGDRERTTDRHEWLTTLERHLMVGLLDILRAELGGDENRCWIAIPDNDDNFRVLDLRGTVIDRVAPIPCKTLQGFLGREHFRLLFNITENAEVAAWIREWSESYATAYDATTSRSQNTQTCLLGLEAHGSLLAVMCIIAKQSQFISYMKAKQASYALSRIGTQMIAARELERRKRNEEIAGPVITMGTHVNALLHDIEDAVGMGKLRSELKFLLNNTCTDEEIHSTLQGILEWADKTIKRVKGIKDHGKRSRDSEKPIVELGTVLRDVVDPYKHAIRINLGPIDGMFVHVDTTLQEAFRFILDNARDATKEKGCEAEINISVDLVERGELRMCKITIEDNGKGMDEETKKHVFDPYFTIKEGPGHGHGLKNAKTTIEHPSRGGLLRIDSPGVDKGATVTVTLPLHFPLEDGHNASDSVC